eukprot:CAMPEP_0174747488 /NCGR_PEP_ID=MMETSP1094-20130205/91326_1 /TAXON_ID=156173 /ORGANISM="Chrysochromulina brevifilum, Strain UTEX LB 985" /LENGTH=63 /DNA_ID=CAMNT_0015952371 /DNA_START=123 /DNA_END=314 /DNA_ORIENTATION=+
MMYGPAPLLEYPSLPPSLVAGTRALPSLTATLKGEGWACGGRWCSCGASTAYAVYSCRWKSSN